MTCFYYRDTPGTGKTTFISELVYQILDRKPNSKILIASRSHVAVDHLLKKIKESMPDVRINTYRYKEKLSDTVINYTLDAFRRAWIKSGGRCEQALIEYKKKLDWMTVFREKHNYFGIDQLMKTISEIDSELARSKN